MLSEELFIEGHKTRSECLGLSGAQAHLQRLEAGHVKAIVHNYAREAPESIWRFCYELTAYSISWLHASGWLKDETMSWLFVRNPWWSLECDEWQSYSRYFATSDWLRTASTLSDAREKMVGNQGGKCLSTADFSVLRLVSDSLAFTQQMYTLRLGQDCTQNEAENDATQ